MIMPKVYLQQGKKSDRDWIQNCMNHIPLAKQEAVADEYERRYNAPTQRYHGRDAANEYLRDIAREYRQDKYAQQKKDM